MKPNPMQARHNPDLKGQPLDRARSLQGIPVLTEHVEIENAYTNERGMVLLSRLPRGRGWLSRFGPPVIERRLELDELGAFVVRNIDGKTDVARIVTFFRERYRVSVREAELSVVAFLKSLIKRGVVAIVIP